MPCSFIGDGFDCPALDTLFLAAAITFKKRLVQYVGRVARLHPGKTTATVHDYHDELTPVLASSLRNRSSGNHPLVPTRQDRIRPHRWSDSSPLNL
jgi:superfamily II DNA or RNA helicase